VFSTLGDFLQVEKMRDLKERRICVKFKKKTFMEAFQMLQQACGEGCLSRMQYHQWYQLFK
jgi:hypothetical protein